MPASRAQSKPAGIFTLISFCGYSVMSAQALGQGLVRGAQRRQHLQRGDDAVAGGVAIEADDVSGVLAADLPARSCIISST
jgi:hypothetical protein